MNADERALIDGLFDRLRAVADAPRDAEAEALIAGHVAQQPYAPYALTQTVLVQEHALQAANARIEELQAALKARDAQPAPGAGSFLGGLFGGGAQTSSPATGRPTSVPSAGQRPERFAYPDAPGAPAANPAPLQPAAPARGAFGGGGFLASALTTAAGVAGGALLYDGIRSMLNTSGSPFGETKIAEAKADEAKSDEAKSDEAKSDEAKSDANADGGSDSGSGWNPWGDSAKSDASEKADASDKGADADSNADASSADDGFFTDLAADDGEAFDGGLSGGYDDSGWA